MRIKGKEIKETDVLVKVLVEYGNSTTNCPILSHLRLL
jgi:hypothetical protein